MGAGETNVPEEETAAARRDGELLTSASQERRQGVATAAEHLAAGELPAPSQGKAVARDALRSMCLDPGPVDEVEEDEFRPDTAEAVRTETPSTGSTSGGGTTGRSRCSRRQLIQLLKEGSECFNPGEVRWIIRVARVGPEGTLNAICMLDDDIALFMHAFRDADDRELRAQCHSTLLEYEESMQAWEEAKDAGESDSSSTDSEDEGELTGGDLLRDLERSLAVISPAATLAAQPGYCIPEALFHRPTYIHTNSLFYHRQFFFFSYAKTGPSQHSIPSCLSLVLSLISLKMQNYG